MECRDKSSGNETFSRMKSFLALLAAAATASAHYTFPALIAGGTTTGQWQYVRKTTNYQSNGPVTDVRPPAHAYLPLNPLTFLIV
jgi:hypothetical protein